MLAEVELRCRTELVEDGLVQGARPLHDAARVHGPALDGLLCAAQHEGGQVERTGAFKRYSSDDGMTRDSRAGGRGFSPGRTALKMSVAKRVWSSTTTVPPPEYRRITGTRALRIRIALSQRIE